MKTLKLSVLSCAMAAMLLMVSMFTGCGLFGDSEDSSSEPEYYSVLYSFNGNNYTITVEYGKFFSIEDPLPGKTGYEFLGLYDSESGGTQFVDSNGLSVSPYYEKSDLKLYPQFKACEYNIVLDYGEATVTGVTTAVAYFGSILPALPGNLTITSKYYSSFSGWYTAENCGGIKVADSTGTAITVFDETLLSLVDSNNYLTLYAGFTVQTYTVNFYESDKTTLIKSVEVEHGVAISSVAPDATANGNEILGWTADGYNSYNQTTVTQDINLYVFSEGAYIGEYTISFTRQNCKKNNGYDPSVSGGTYDIKTHYDFELAQLNISGCTVNADGSFSLVDGCDLKISLELLQNTSSLPRNTSIGANWYTNKLNNDTYSGAVTGTNLNGSQIGYGAYYVKITYTDATYTETNGVNIFSSMQKNQSMELSLDIDENKTISDIEIVVVYEIEYGYYDGWWHTEWSNWRCTAELNFT